MSNKLKIYACSGFQAGKEFKYLMPDDTRTVDNTQVVNMMLNNINLARTEIAYLTMPQKDVIARYNLIDLCEIIRNAAERYAKDEKEMYAAGEAITIMLDNGLFECDSTDEAERAEHLDKLFDCFETMMSEGVTVDDREQMVWWKKEVMPYCKVGLDEKQRKIVTNVLEKKMSVSGTAQSDLAEHIDKAGTYFLYTYFTEDQLNKLPRYFRSKAKGQWRTYNYDLPLFKTVYGQGELAFKQAIYASIVKQFGDTPQNVCSDIVAGKRKIDSVSAIGIDDIIAILIAILPFLVEGIKAICNAVTESHIAKYEAVSKEDIEATVPEPDDLGGGTKKAGLGGDTLLLVAGATLLYGILNENN